MENAQRTRTKRVVQLTAEDARILEALKKSSADAKRKAVANGLPFIAGKKKAWDAAK